MRSNLHNTPLSPAQGFHAEALRRTDLFICTERQLKKTSSVYDCTVEDVEYIYNTLNLLVTLSRHLVVVITLP